MIKRALFSLILVILGGVLIGLIFFQKGQENKAKEIKKEGTKMTENLSGKKVLMIIAFRNFRDQEYFVPKKVFEEAKIEVKTASNEKGIAIGADGGDAKVDYLISEVSVNDFDAVVFVGGPGALQNLDNENSYKLAKEAINNGKVLGAICISPVILAKAGVLSQKRATVWTDFTKSQAKTLKEYGAIFEDKEVVVDGNIVTGNGPEAAENFAKKIIELLQ
jgi:protease I